MHIININAKSGMESFEINVFLEDWYIFLDNLSIEVKGKYRKDALETYKTMEENCYIPYCLFKLFLEDLGKKKQIMKNPALGDPFINKWIINK